MKKLLNLKRLLKARNSSGFTLVEVILSCALLSILILGIMMFVTPVLRMVTSGQKNARATMLSETLDTYVAGVLRTAAVVEVFDNVDLSSSTGGALNLKPNSPGGEGIYKIEEFMNGSKDGVPNNTTYEVRSLAIVCKDTGEITTQGVRVYNASVDPASLTLNVDSLNTGNQALNDLMYEGLYSTITLENFETQDPSTGDPTGVLAKGYKITTTVYNDSKCYDPDANTRDKSIQAFTGVTYFQAFNLNEPSGVIHVNADPATAIAGHEAEEGKLFYPATIIYYVAPKK